MPANGPWPQPRRGFRARRQRRDQRSNDRRAGRRGGKPSRVESREARPFRSHEKQRGASFSRRSRGSGSLAALPEASLFRCADATRTLTAAQRQGCERRAVFPAAAVPAREARWLAAVSRRALPRATDRGRDRGEAIAATPRGDLSDAAKAELVAVADAVNEALVVVRHVERTVAPGCEARRAAAHVTVLQPAGDEVLGTGRLAVFHHHAHNSVADLRRDRRRPVQREEQRVAVG